MYNKNGLKFFIYNTTINNNKYMELPIEIRQYIWNKSHIYPIIQCYICDKILINFNIAINNTNHNENYTIINGLTKCNRCYFD